MGAFAAFFRRRPAAAVILVTAGATLWACGSPFRAGEGSAGSSSGGDAAANTSNTTDGSGGDASSTTGGQGGDAAATTTGGGGCVMPQSPPGGFEGPFYLALATEESELPTCVSGEPTTRFRGVEPGDHTCTCDCQIELSGCQRDIEHGANDCSTSTSTLNAGCNTGTGSMEIATRAKIAPITDSVDGCSASPLKNTSQPTLINPYRLCPVATDASGCLLPPPGGYEPTICIAKEGDASCPEGTVETAVGYDGYADNRDCDECDCDVSGVTCGGTVKIYSQPGCQGDSNDITALTCSQLDGTIASAQYMPVPVGACGTSGGNEIGAVEPTGDQVVCCVE